MTDFLPVCPDQGCAADMTSMTHAQMHAQHQQVMPCSTEHTGHIFQSCSQVHASRNADRQSQLLRALYLSHTYLAHHELGSKVNILLLLLLLYLSEAHHGSLDVQLGLMVGLPS